MENCTKFISKNKLKSIILLLIILTITIMCIVCANYNKQKIIEVAKEQKLKVSQTTVPEGYIGISTAEELTKINENLSGNYILMADIDMTGVEFDIIGKTSSTAFSGIFDGNEHTISNLNIESDNQSVGLFGYVNNGTIEKLTLENVSITNKNIYMVGGLVGNGENITIDNLRLKNMNIENVSANLCTGGLIGRASNAIITNSYIIGDGIITGTTNVGGLIGETYIRNNFQGKIDSLYSTVKVIGTNKVGGLVGSASSGTITNSYATGNVSGETQIGGLVGYGITITNSNATGDVSGQTEVGGLVGYGRTITNSYATGDVSGESNVGGLVGSLSGVSADIGTITNSYATGSISGKNKIGGLVGFNYKHTEIRNSYAAGDVSGQTEVGSLVGTNDFATSISTSADIIIINTYAIGKVNGVTNGGLTGGNVNGIIRDSYWAIDTTKQLSSVNGGEAKLIKEMLYQSNYRNWDFDSTWKIKEGGKSLPYLKDLPIPNEILEENIDYFRYEGGTGTKEDPYVIATIEQLKSIKQTETFSQGKYFVLANDIDASEIENLEPIQGKFKGILNGNNHTINNLVIKSEENYIGLFKENSGTIKNIRLNNVNVESNYNGETAYIGGICAYNSGIIKGIEVNGKIKNIGTIQNLYIGQIVGYNNGKINKTHSNGTIENIGNINNAYIGGITGYNNTTILMSYNTGNTIINNVENLSYGGIAGKSNLTIRDCYSKGNNNINAKTVTIGGISGENSGIIKNTYSTDIIEKQAEEVLLGGIVGKTKFEVISSYYDISNIEEQEKKGSKRTLEELRQQATFEDWNFEKIWSIEEKVNTPTFLQETYNSDEDYIDEEYYGDDFWEWHTRTTTDDQAYNGKHIIINPGESIDFYGYGVTSYKDYLYKYYTNAGKKTFMFKIDETDASYHTLDGAGFIFNAKKEDNLLSGYILLIREKEISIYRLDNVNAATFETASNSRVSTYGTLVESVPKNSSTIHNLIVETSPTNVNVVDNGEEILNIELDYSKHSGEDFGLIASYEQHDCNILSKIKFMEFTVEIKDYKIPVIKTDEFNNRLSGANFQLKNESGEILREGITNENGVLEFKGLQEGIYTIEEIEAPAKHAFKNNTITFKVTNDGKVVNVETGEEIAIKIVNEKLKFIVNVEDINGNPIENSVIAIYDKEGNEIIGSNGKTITVTTGSTGTATFIDIDEGEYTFKQIEVPEGYILNETTYGVKVDKNGNVTFTDTTNGIIYNNRVTNTEGITIYKYRINSGKALAGAVIGVFDSKGNKVREQTTNVDGEVTFTGLEVGSYYYQELKAPAGYKLNDTKYKFTVYKDGSVDFPMGRIIYDNPIIMEEAITITKKERGTDTPLEGAVIGIFNIKGNKVKQGTTNKNGAISFNGLEVGEYYYKEITAPEGYMLNDTEYHFTVENNGKITLADGTTNVIYNDKINTNITVNKVWGDNNNSAGKRPESVIIVAKSGESEIDQVELTVANALNGDENTWQGQIENLPKYDSKGNEIVYTIDEKEVNSGDLRFYSKIINQETRTITNTFTVPEEKVGLTVTKIWEDNNNSGGKRPASVIIVAKRGNDEIGQVELTEANAIEGNTNIWRGQIENLPKYDSNGNEIEYTIDEKEVNVGDLSLYTKNIDQETRTVINILRLQKTKYKVEHYLRNLDQEVEGYNYEEEYFEAKPGDFVTAVPKEYEGFVENTSHPNRIPSGVVLEDGTLILKLYYNREQYTITYILNGGEATRKLTGSYIYGTELYLSRKVEKEGYEFIGWYNNENFEGDIITKIERGEKGNKVFYAKWEQKGLNSDTYKVNETKKQISQVSPLTTVGKFLDTLNLTQEAKVYDLKGNEVSKDKLVGTGYVVKLNDGNEYQIAVSGDLDGNGEVTITDLSIMNQAIIGKRKLSEIVEVAADMDKNEKLTITDLSMLNQYILKK